MTAEEIWLATICNECSSVLSNYVLHGRPSTKAEIKKEVQGYCSLRDEIVIISVITMKGRRRILLFLQKKAPD